MSNRWAVAQMPVDKNIEYRTPNIEYRSEENQDSELLCPFLTFDIRYWVFDIRYFPKSVFGQQSVKRDDYSWNLAEVLQYFIVN